MSGLVHKLSERQAGVSCPAEHFDSFEEWVKARRRPVYFLACQPMDQVEGAYARDWSRVTCPHCRDRLPALRLIQGGKTDDALPEMSLLRESGRP